MAFCLSPKFSPIPDYATALRRWENTKPWKGYDIERPLDKNRSKKHMRIIYNSWTHDIHLQLHGTNVVTYHKDGRITFRPWNSISTDAFVNRCCIPGVSAWFHSNAIVIDRRIYQAREKITIVPNGKPYYEYGEPRWSIDPATMPEPWEELRINRKRANAALKKYNFKAFKNWYDCTWTLLRSTKTQPEGSRWDAPKGFCIIEALELGVEG